MIGKLYFLRHGQSETNALHVYAGARSEVQLTDHGRAQAKTAGKLLAHDGITKIIASDYDRARETAEIVARELNYTAADITFDSRIREINVGALTGQPNEGFSAYLEHVESGADPAAESIQQVAERITPVLRELEQDSGTVLIVAHAGIGRVMRTLLTGVPIEDVARLDVPNAHPFEMPIQRIENGEI